MRNDLCQLQKHEKKYKIRPYICKLCQYSAFFISHSEKLVLHFITPPVQNYQEQQIRNIKRFRTIRILLREQ